MGNDTSKLMNQSYVVPNSEEPGKWGPIHRSALAPEKVIDTLPQPEVTTLYHLWQHAVSNNQQRPCLGVRAVNSDGSRGEYVWKTFAEVNTQVKNFGAGLKHLGIKAAEHIGIYSINRPEYVIAEHACYAQSLIMISLYDTLGPDAIVYIVNQAEITTVICSKDKISKVLEVAPQCPSLKNIIQMEKELDKVQATNVTEKGLSLLTFHDVEERGAANPLDDSPPTPSDLATIMYTSGTTGLPKGVLLSHSNAIAFVSGAFAHGVRITNSDVHISYLPMAHIFERVVQYMLFYNGGAAGFFQGEVLKLFDDIATLKPTVFASVPRLFNRLFDKVNSALQTTGGFKKVLFDWAYKSKQSTLDSGGGPTSMVWDKLVFDKMRARLGGRVRLIITGSAPISIEVYRFLQICFCCPVIQGYGMTETSAASTLTLPDDQRPGHVGPPLPCTEIRLADVPDMHYTSRDQPNPRGEICFRGPNITRGYYKDDEKTKETIDEEGWLHSGDIGQWNDDGTLTIIDRKKNIFKLSQGEYVAAEYLESVYTKNQYVQQIFVYGDSLQSCLVAIVVPDPETVVPWAKENKIADPENIEALSRNDVVKKFLLQQLTITGKELKLKGFEFVKAIHVEHSPFTVENDLLTPTFKPKRPVLKERYKQEIGRLYDTLKEESG